MKDIALIKGNPLTALIRFRLQWHAQVIRQILIKYKILLIFLLLLVAPSIETLIGLIILPVKTIFSDEVNLLGITLSLVGYQGMSLVWFYIQASAFNPTKWHNYLISLPITKKQIFLSDLFLLSISNVVIFIPLFITFKEAIGNMGSNFIRMIILAENVSNVILIIMNVQLICLRKRYNKFPYIVLMNILFLGKYFVRSCFIENILFFISIVISLHLIKSCYVSPAVKSLVRKTIKEKYISIKYHKILFPQARVHLKHILKSNLLWFVQIIVGFLLLLAGIYILIVHCKQEILINFIIFCFSMLSALCISPIFSTLKLHREQYLISLKVLPYTRYNIFFNDNLIALSLQIIFLLVSNLFIVYQVDYRFIHIIENCFCSILFLICTYYPQTTYKKYGTIISIMIMVFFIWLKYYYTYRL